MKNWYRCEMCECYVDPDEYPLCEECRAGAKRRARYAERMESAIREAENGQYRMNLVEVVG